MHQDSGRWWWRCERDAQKLFNDYYMHFDATYDAFTGVNLSDFEDLQDFFKINLVVQEWKRRLLEWFNLAGNYSLKQ